MKKIKERNISVVKKDGSLPFDKNLRQHSDGISVRHYDFNLFKEPTKKEIEEANRQLAEYGFYHIDGTGEKHDTK